MVLKRTGADDESMRMFEARVDPDECVTSRVL